MRTYTHTHTHTLRREEQNERKKQEEAESKVHLWETAEFRAEAGAVFQRSVIGTCLSALIKNYAEVI